MNPGLSLQFRGRATIKLILVLPTKLVKEPGIVRGSVCGRGVYAKIIPGCLACPHLLTATKLVNVRKGRFAVVLTEKIGPLEHRTNRPRTPLAQLLL